MTRLKVDVDPETLERLIEDAGRELRPVSMHVTVLLRRSLGLVFPYPMQVRQDPDASHLAANPDERPERG